ncbi:hypothetical protein NL108_018688 [Boleophthalmus pectinirostris]|nr:hypothetical protein NL108_018688 [Boleophthalmus pectinirostris]
MKLTRKNVAPEDDEQEMELSRRTMSPEKEGQELIRSDLMKLTKKPRTDTWWKLRTSPRVDGLSGLFQNAQIASPPLPEDEEYELIRNDVMRLTRRIMFPENEGQEHIRSDLMKQTRRTVSPEDKEQELIRSDLMKLTRRTVSPEFSPTNPPMMEIEDRSTSRQLFWAFPEQFPVPCCQKVKITS